MQYQITVTYSGQTIVSEGIDALGEDHANEAAETMAWEKGIPPEQCEISVQEVAYV